MSSFEPTERTRLKRKPERGAYERETVYAILDEALFCHVAYAVDGHPRAIPTVHCRIGDTLYLHGSEASRTAKAIRDGAEVCVVATLLDDLVLARSGMHHSMNYRSAVVYGRAREVTDREEKLLGFRALVDHVVAGRADEVRDPNDDELRQTMLLAVPLEEASAKIRTGPPKDDEEDYELPVWAGLLPMRLEPQPPVDDPELAPGLTPPPNVTDYRRPKP